MNTEIAKAIVSLEIWLSDSRKLGHKPSKIEYVNEFKNDDGTKCMIFKFKNNLSDNWCLGIVSDFETFSEMKEYKQETEIEDSKNILKMLKDRNSQIIRNEFEMVIKQFNYYKINEQQFLNWIITHKESIKLYDAILFNKEDLQDGILKRNSKVLIRETSIYTSSEIMKELINRPHICAPSSLNDLYNRLNDEKMFVINPGSHDYGFSGNKSLLKNILGSK